MSPSPQPDVPVTEPAEPYDPWLAEPPHPDPAHGMYAADPSETGR